MERIYLEEEEKQEIILSNKPQIIKIDHDEIIPIVLSNRKTPELILGKRFNDNTERIEYLVKFIELPIENAEWWVKERIANKKLIKNFEQKSTQCQKFQVSNEKRYHHIGQNSLQKFLNQAQYIKNWELQGDLKQYEEQMETIDIHEEVIEINQLKFIYNADQFSQKVIQMVCLGQRSKQSKEHKNEITDPRFQFDLLVDKHDTLNLDRTITDENFLNQLGIYMPEVEKRTAYYKILHNEQMYHVFNAEKLHYYDLIKQINPLIQGKHKPTKNLSCNKKGDKVIVMNASRLFLYKRDMKRNYYYHIGIPGHLKAKNYKELYQEKPQSLIIYGVWKSLKRNKARFSFMENLEVYNGLEVPYDFLPNFTPTPNVDKSQFQPENLLKDVKLLSTEFVSEDEIPDFLKDKQVGQEVLEKLEDQKLHYNIPKKVMKKITQYNRWVEDQRDKREKYKPKEPRVGRKIPFSGDRPLYVTKDEKRDMEKYPILKKLKEASEKMGEPNGVFAGQYNYGLEKHYNVKYQKEDKED